MQKKLLLTLLLLIVLQVLLSSTIDSLLTGLPNAIGEERIMLLNQLSVEYRYIDPQKSVDFSEMALKSAIDLDLPTFQSLALNNSAVGHFFLGNYNLALEKHQEALKLNQEMGDSSAIARSYNNLGLVYKKIGDYDKALEYNLESLALERDHHNRGGIAQSLCNIGNLYFEMSDFPSSLEYYQESLLLYEELDDYEGMADILNNMGIVYDEESKYDVALDYYLNSLDYELELKNKTGIATTSNNIGLTYYNVGLYDKALEYLNWSLNLTLEIGEKYGVANSYLNLGKTRFAMGDLSKALNQTRNGLSIATQIEAPDLMMAAYNQLAEIYTELKQFGKALENYKLYDNQREILFYQGRDKFTLIQAQFDLQQMQKEVDELHYKVRLYWIIIIVLVGMILLIMLFSFIIRNNIRNKEIRKQEQINKQLIELAQTDHLTNLANRRGMLDKIQYEKYRFERSGKAFSLIMGDIDGFKRVNDQFGHECGDFVLSSLSNLFVSILRKQDIVGRWGGEEFILLLPETQLKEARSLAEKIRHRIEHNYFYYRGSEISITITFGVASFDQMEDIEKTIHRADEALYKGKRLGKNCVV